MSSNATTSVDILTEQARDLKVSATLEINELVTQRLKENKPVVHLGFGEATFPVQKDVLETFAEARRDTRYLPVAGLDRLRESVAQSLSRRLVDSVSPQQVVIAPGSKPLLFALFDILQGDVLLPRPSWVSYEPQVKHAGKRLFWVETSEKDRHDITQSSLQSAYDQAVSTGGNPRIMLINSPSNPTGRVFSEDTLTTISGFCRDHDITLISDEIYSDIHFAEGDYLSVASNGRCRSTRMILTGGISKTYSAGGWRVGYAVFPNDDFGITVQRAILAYASECWSAATAPAQAAAAVALESSPIMDLYRKQVSTLHAYGTRRLYEALKNCGLDVPEPQGAFYLYPSFHPFTAQLKALDIHTSDQLSRWLIDQFGVATLPGSVFGEDDARGLPGGRYRLRMATSGLYFRDENDRYGQGYDMLEKASLGHLDLDLPLLDRAVEALQGAVAALKQVSV